jgi:two-component system, LytTR family, response regulator
MQNQSFPVSVAEGQLQLNPYDIIRLKASSNYTFIYFTNRRPLIAAKILKNFEAKLNQFGFIRTHRKHLINRQYISRISNNKTIIMSDDSVAEISRRQKAAVLKKLRAAA